MVLHLTTVCYRSHYVTGTDESNILTRMTNPPFFGYRTFIKRIDSCRVSLVITHLSRGSPHNAAFHSTPWNLRERWTQKHDPKVIPLQKCVPVRNNTSNSVDDCILLCQHKQKNKYVPSRIINSSSQELEAKPDGRRMLPCCVHEIKNRSPAQRELR